MNLVINAVNYSPEGSSIVLSLREKDGMAELVVTDAGIGLSDQERSRVFDLFYQGATRNSKSGLGVGLTLCKRIVERHRGAIEVASAGKGRGTTFTVRLPATRSPVTAAKPADAAAAVKARTVVVIDDNEDGRTSLAMLLRDDGHVVHEFSNGIDGLRGTLEIRPDVAVVDIGMPLMNGYEVAARLRHASHRPLCLIALTGYGQAEDVEHALASGFDAHLVKPVRLNELRAAMERHCAGPADRVPSRSPRT